MKTTDNTLDPLAVLADANPYPPDRIAALERAPQRERTWALILARCGEQRGARSSLAKLTPRRVAIAAAVVIALAVPSLALSSQLGSLLGFSNRGTSVDKRKIDLNAASALDTTGASKGTVKLLSARAGIGIYVARDDRGNLCYFAGPPNRNRLGERGLSGGCLNAAASRQFPSPAEPVIDMSAFTYRPGAVGEEVRRLAGIAADGVAKVQVLGLDCQVVTEAPVADNVYAGSDLPEIPAVAIRGLDENGKQVFLYKMRFWDKSVCESTAQND